MVLLLAALATAFGLGTATMALLRLDGAAVSADDPAGAGLVYRVLEPVLRVVADLGRRLAPQTRVEQLRRRIVHAGREAVLTPERMLTRKAGGGLAGLLLGLIVPWPFGIRVAVAVALAAVMFVLPDALLGAAADRRQQAVARDLPEALDLLAITVEAGVGLEQAILIVSENLPGPLGDEFTRMLREIQLGVPRREALGALRARTDVAELSAFVAALVQADQMGAAIADVLKAQAGQVRLRRRQRARERAAKTPVKILFPLVFGILPAIFIVTLGPAFLSIARAFAGR